MKKLAPLLALLILSCSTPLTKTSINYQGTDAFDKMLLALTETGWEIQHTEKTSGIISAKKMLTSEAVSSAFAGTSAKSHVATIKIDGENISITVSQPGEASPLGAGQYDTDALSKEIVAKFQSLTRAH